jgi:thiol-disulfide isomerase/thioredoxin
MIAIVFATSRGGCLPRSLIAWPSRALLVLAAMMATLQCGQLNRHAALAEEPRPKSREPSTAKSENAASQSGQEDDESAPKVGAAGANPFPQRVKSPDLEGGSEWLNASGEITLKDLRGKVVLLDFWTYCCINCMHVLPDLKHLEQKFNKQLVVVGVHSAKFENEKDSDNIRRAIVRYEIEHPVINDDQMTIWRKFGVRAWPTLVLIDPEGYYCGYISGEGHREVLEQVLDRLIEYHRAKGTLDEAPVRFDLERHRAPKTPLRFPGKIIADAQAQRLFIADSNHNRIVVAGFSGQLQETIGSGAIGREDGSFEKASFDHPQGMALVGQTLYVADTENHLIRAVDLKARTVATVAGTGKLGQERRHGGPAMKTALNSPWDLVEENGKLYIAMAGPHQIWVLDPKEGVVRPFAGSGREDVGNGRLGFAARNGDDPEDEPAFEFDNEPPRGNRISAFAQPSGIVSDRKFLYVVDSEGSAVRRVPLDPSGLVTTIVGTSDLPHGQSLFAFGDRDGVGEEARLQHPLGIAFFDGRLYVADSYNHKIKVVDPKSNEAITLAVPADAGRPSAFSEPGGLCVTNGTLYVADTNNHRIVKVDLQTNKATTLPIVGLAAPDPPRKSAEDSLASKPVKLQPVLVSAQSAVEFRVALSLPEGYKLNRLAPPTYRVKALDEGVLIARAALGAKEEARATENEAAVVFELPLAEGARKGLLEVTVSIAYCREGTGGLCKMRSRTFVVPVELSNEARSNSVELTMAEDNPD